METNSFRIIFAFYNDMLHRGIITLRIANVFLSSGMQNTYETNLIMIISSIYLRSKETSLFFQKTWIQPIEKSKDGKICRFAQP